MVPHLRGGGAGGASAELNLLHSISSKLANVSSAAQPNRTVNHLWFLSGNALLLSFLTG